jgi:hypothetical protein
MENVPFSIGNFKIGRKSIRQLADRIDSRVIFIFWRTGLLKLNPFGIFSKSNEISPLRLIT